MHDYMIRATAVNGQIRAFAAVTTKTVEDARKAHNTSPVVTAGLGRMLTAGVMMGSMMKGGNDLITVKAEGDGPVGHILVTADAEGNVKGYAANPTVYLPANSAGKLDVGGLFGKGTLTVIKDMGLKEPYSGSCALVSGEIANDLTYYFALSEQTPSAVGLGVLMSKENTVQAAGGFLVQIMPGAAEDTVEKLEERIGAVDSVTNLLSAGKTPEDILQQITDAQDLAISDRMPVRFHCNCSKDRVSNVLTAIGKKELREMIDEGKAVEVNCRFCNTAYVFSVQELEALLHRGQSEFR